MEKLNVNQSKIMVIDFGSQYSLLIVRRLREIGVYSELRHWKVAADQDLFDGVEGFILSGGPFSVYDPDAPHLHESFWTDVERLDIPILGICYGLHEIIYATGGKVAPASNSSSSGYREFGSTEMRILSSREVIDTFDRAEQPIEECTPTKEERTLTDELFAGIAKETTVWMSHGDTVEVLSAGFIRLAETDNCHYAAVRMKILGYVSPLQSINSSHDSAKANYGNLGRRRWWGVQFHPEVKHTVSGTQLLKNFAINICGLAQKWEMGNFLATEIPRIRQLCSDKHVIGALSGGIDSTVAAALVHSAVGVRFHAIHIDNGLLRHSESDQVALLLHKEMPNLNLVCIDASDIFLDLLKNITDPEKKRKIIGQTFIQQLEAAIQKLGIKVEDSFLLQGTLYPDVIESMSTCGSNIKIHHNVGGLPENMKLTLLEPLRNLFKDEVRQLAKELGLSSEIIDRHPFPGPGLAIRIVGEVTRENVKILQQADKIYLEEIQKSGHYDKISQAFVVLLTQAKSVGVMGDSRTYEMTAVLRAVQTEDFMTADWYRFPYETLAKIASRIVNEVIGINRVCYDISSKPPLS